MSPQFHLSLLLAWEPFSFNEMDCKNCMCRCISFEMLFWLYFGTSGFLYLCTKYVWDFYFPLLLVPCRVGQKPNIMATLFWLRLISTEILVCTDWFWFSKVSSYIVNYPYTNVLQDLAWILHNSCKLDLALTCPIKSCKVLARSSGFLHCGENLAVSASSKLMMQDILQSLLHLALYYVIPSIWPICTMTTPYPPKLTSAC